MFFTDYTKRRAKGIASVWSNKIQNLSYRGTFQWIFDRELWHLVRVSREFELSEFELSGFYCIYSITPHDKSECLTCTSSSRTMKVAYSRGTSSMLTLFLIKGLKNSVLAKFSHTKNLEWKLQPEKKTFDHLRNFNCGVTLVGSGNSVSWLYLPPKQIMLISNLFRSEKLCFESFISHLKAYSLDEIM